MSFSQSPSKYDLWRAKSEEQLADEYLTGIPDPENNAWWICQWQAAALIGPLKERYWDPMPEYVKEIYGEKLGWSVPARRRRA